MASMYRKCDLRERQDLGGWQADVVFCDSPWWYADQRKERKDGAGPTKGIGACHHYDQIKTADLCKLPLTNLFADRCHMYMWATGPLLPDALQLMDALGFRWATIAFVWGKTNQARWEDAQAAVWQSRLIPTDGDAEVKEFLAQLMFFGPGYYTGSNIELVLLGTRGKPYYHATGRKAAQWVFAEGVPGTQVVYGPVGGHSRKPEEPQDRIEWMYPKCKRRLELFGRRDRGGWVVLGNENIFPLYIAIIYRVG